MHLAMGDIEILVGPVLEPVIIIGAVRIAGALQRGVEIFGVFRDRGGRVQVGTAAEPALGRHQESGVHVDRRHDRVGHMRDQADARRKEAGVFGRAMDGLGEIALEAAADGGDVDADFFENLAGHHPAHAAAARCAAGVRSIPGGIVEPRVRSRLALDGFELGADHVAQAFKPGACCLLLVVELHHSSPGQPLVCRKASPKAIAAATATFNDRRPGTSGIRTTKSAAASTSAGSPRDSAPSNRVSPG